MRYIKFFRTSWLLTVFLSMSNLAFAEFTYLVSMEGKKGERVAYYVGSNVLSRTPVNMKDLFASTYVSQITMYIVYEAEPQPEWSIMRLQFVCHHKKDHLGKVFANVPNATDPVQVRVADNSVNFIRRTLNGEAIPETEFSSIGSHVMLQTQKVACLEHEQNQVSKAVVNAIKNNHFNKEDFNQKLKLLGFQAPIHVVDVDATAPALTAFTWKMLWEGSVKPVSPADRVLTKAEIDERAKQLGSISEKMNTLKSRIEEEYLPEIEKKHIDDAFAKYALKIRGSRELSNTESSAIMIWQGQTEELLIMRMGAGLFSEADQLRFRRYSQSFDNRAFLQNRSTGQVIESGVLRSCDVDFVLAKDKKHTFRVADVRISTSTSDIRAGGNACQDLIKTPQNASAK
ncbi:hypothetical protein [Undibacterium macrobrachii]|nr:hypothetical protein [Undibacterium macrobrachii]